MLPLDVSFPQMATMLMVELGMAKHPTPVQLQLMDAIENPSSNRLILSGFRGVGKSTIAAMGCLWWLHRDPTEKILILSASMSRARSMSVWMQFVTRRIEWLNHLAPHDVKEWRSSVEEWDVGCCHTIEQSPSVRPAGMNGQIVGSRASKILADDIETVQTALTATQRERLSENVNEFESIIKPIEEQMVLLLGTPHNSTDSIYFKMARDRGYQMLMWPARVPESLKPYGDKLAPLIHKRMPHQVGQVTDTRFSDDELQQRQSGMSPGNWRMQYMLDCTLSDANRFPLRLGDLVVMPLGQYLPEVVHYDRDRDSRITDLQCIGLAHDPWYYRPASFDGSKKASDTPTVMVIDPSGGGTDEFAWCVMSAWGGNYYLRDLGGEKGGVSPELWIDLAARCARFNVKQVVFESNFGGLEVWSQSFKPYLAKEGHQCKVEGKHTGGMRKEIRIIDSLAPVMQTHRLVVDRRILEEDYEKVRGVTVEKDLAYSVAYQLSRLTEERGALLHDDKIDTMALAVEWFQEQSALDQEVHRSANEHAALLAEFADERTGEIVMTLDRMLMGMDLETAKKAHARSSGPVNALRSGLATARRRRR